MPIHLGTDPRNHLKLFARSLLERLLLLLLLVLLKYLITSFEDETYERNLLPIYAIYLLVRTFIYTQSRLTLTVCSIPGKFLLLRIIEG